MGSRLYEVSHYEGSSGRDVFQDWLDSLKDNTARVAVQRRVDRLSRGNFGDCRSCREGVWELKIDWGPGYRVYYALVGKAVVLLLAGGDKSTQKSDIDRAARNLAEFRRRQS